MAVYAYLEMIYTPLNRLSEMNIYYANSRAAIDRLFEFFDQKHEPQEEDSRPLSVRRGKIELQDVHFGYADNGNGNQSPLFRGINLQIPAGWRVALVGPSGAGKSTMIKLLVRFFEPRRGRILIDGQDIRGVNLNSLRSQVAVVQQDLMLFSGTIEENIRLGKPEASFEEILGAAEMANARNFIEALPKKFQTEIGERGIRLSGGQKQLIAITRAFLKNAPVLVLDESTSNMDSPSEKLIYEALQRLMKNRTTIIIAHRLSTVTHADMIVVLDRGRIVQKGTHDDLLRSAKGVYHNLYSNSLKGVRQADIKAVSSES
jgi:subfamily B ATP-binding cassette protein MsbA